MVIFLIAGWTNAFAERYFSVGGGDQVMVSVQNWLGTCLANIVVFQPIFFIRDCLCSIYQRKENMKKLLQTLAIIVVIIIVACLGIRFGINISERNKEEKRVANEVERIELIKKYETIVKPIPVSKPCANYILYEKLFQLDPYNSRYEKKVNYYLSKCTELRKKRRIQQEVNREINRKAQQRRNILIKQIPKHKFNLSIRRRSQIRAIVKRGSLTESNLKQIAVNLCKNHPSLNGCYLVHFFSNVSCLDQWDGTGLLRDSDWPYWVCRIAVDTDSTGKLYARTFKVAIDENTGEDQTDVILN